MASKKARKKTAQGGQARAAETLAQLSLREKVSLLSGVNMWQTAAIERLSVGSLVVTDGPHGIRAPQGELRGVVGAATAFPTGVAMAASFDPELIERVGAALAEETLAFGCDVLLGPCINIVRHPLGGRNFETFGEDPHLSGQIGIAYVRGVQSRGVGTSLKHYACNNQEHERGRGDSVVDERTLREIYLPAFEAVVKVAEPWTVMCAYNRINGAYASQNTLLLRRILKEEWGFAGIVMSDWGANHTTCDSVLGGLDLEMPGPARWFGGLLADAVNNWQVPDAVVDEAALRMLTLAERAGKLGKSVQKKGAKNTPQHQKLARELAEASMVLLKNEGDLLPLASEEATSIAVIGPNAKDFRIGGGGSSAVEPPFLVTPLEALEEWLPKGASVSYAEGTDNFGGLPVLGGDSLVPHQAGAAPIRGEVFGNLSFKGDPASVREDNQLSHWWLHPGAGVDPSEFAVRFRATLKPERSCHYVFSALNTGRSRVYVDGKLILDHDAYELTQPDRWCAKEARVKLVAGREYEVRVDYVKPRAVGFAIVQLNCAPALAPGEDHRIREAAELAARSRAAVVFVGMPPSFESEGGDRASLELPNRQNELVAAVAKANPNTIVVVNVGAPVSMPWLGDVRAVIAALYPGMMGGAAIWNLVFGKTNPSGKLPVTFPVRVEDTPAFINYPGGRTVRYGEGLFVGYRYYDKKLVEPLFPFGHGLSYTEFEYSKLKVPAKAERGEKVRVSLTLRNTGKRQGREVVQVYVRDVESSVQRPDKELKAFKKVELRPGETKTVEFALEERAFAFYDVDGRRWVVEPGKFEILVGSSSRDIRVSKTCEIA